MKGPPALAPELYVAELAAREAGSVVARLFGGRYTVSEKSRGNPVTSADLAANEAIHEVLAAHYPGDAWLSEEDQDDLERLQARRVWIVDPIDGTREFIQGVPHFCVSIALVVDSVVSVGVVYNPLQQQLFCSLRGHGATLNETPLRVTSRQEPEGAHLLVSRSEPRQKYRNLQGFFRLERRGSIAYRLASVASRTGDATLTFRTVKEWDVCAGVLIVEEAGGVVIDWAGRRPSFNQKEPFFRGLIAGNRRLTEEILKRLA